MVHAGHLAHRSSGTSKCRILPRTMWCYWDAFCAWFRWYCSVWTGRTSEVSTTSLSSAMWVISHNYLRIDGLTNRSYIEGSGVLSIDRLLLILRCDVRKDMVLSSIAHSKQTESESRFAHTVGAVLHWHWVLMRIAIPSHLLISDLWCITVGISSTLGINTWAHRLSSAHTSGSYRCL